MYAPAKLPTIPPRIDATKAKKTYLIIMCKEENPNDFKVPISLRSSSTSRLIEIKLIKVATIKKTRGNTCPKFLILCASSKNSLYVA